jgi:hypothetical protein
MDIKELLQRLYAFREHLEGRVMADWWHEVYASDEAAEILEEFDRQVIHPLEDM